MAEELIPMGAVNDPQYLANSLRYWQRKLWWHRFVLGKDLSDSQVRFALERCRSRRVRLNKLLNADR